MADAREALRIFSTELGQDHPNVAHAEARIGAILLDSGRAGDALPHLERSLQIRRTRVGDQMLLGQSELFVARALIAAGRSPDRALGLAEAARERFRGAGEEAEPYLEEVDAFLRNELGG